MTIQPALSQPVTLSQPLTLSEPVTPRPLTQETSPQDEVSLSGAGAGRRLAQGAAALAGGAAGYAAGRLATQATLTAGGLASEFIRATSLPVGALPGLGGLGDAALLLAAGGHLLGIGAGVAAGAGIAWFAASGARKIDDAIAPQAAPGGGRPGRLKEGLKADGLHLAASLQNVREADSLKEAAGQGFQAGAALGGRAGMYAGRVQGALMGGALGIVASLPVASLIHGAVALPLPGVLAVALPVALVGGALGGRLGEAVGHTVGTVAGGAVGAAGATLYHSVRGVRAQAEEGREG